MYSLCITRLTSRKKHAIMLKKQRRITMGEIKQTNFRINAETADAFRKFCEEQGMNQAQGFDHIMQIVELDRAKGVVPERQVEIEEFERAVKSIMAAYLGSLEINNNAEKRIKEQFASDLIRKDKTIDELRDKIEQLQLDKKATDAALKEALTKAATAEEHEKTALDQAASAKKDADNQERINIMLSAKLAESDEKLAGYDDLKKSEQEANIEIQKLKQNIIDLNKDHAAEINALKKDAELEKERALAEKERELQAAIQKAELKAAMLSGKLEEKEARIKELSSQH